MEKLVQQMARQLQAIIAEEMNLAAMGLYERFRSANAISLYDCSPTRNQLELQYQNAAEQVHIVISCALMIANVAVDGECELL